VPRHTLVNRNVLAMTDPVSKFYPDLTRAADITLADLGGHIAGYRDYYPLDYVDERLRSPIAPDALIARYAKLPLDFEPRARYSYSNTGFTILARVVEQAAAMPYAKLLEASIFDPLAMTSATLVRPPTAATGHVAFLLDSPEPAPLEADGWLFGAGDIWASAIDLAKWNLAIADGKLLSEASRRALSTPSTLSNGRSTSYSCGLGVRNFNGETVLGHSGWVGGFHTYNAIIPRTRSAVVFFVNDEHVDLGDLYDTVLRLVTDDPSVIPAIAGPPAAEAARALVLGLQRGVIDRTKLGDDLGAYFDDARIAASATALRALGEPTIKVISQRERGGMEVTTLEIAFPSRTVNGSMFRSPDGKIRQLLLQ
jgi:CubicO group peptidase (beta-lactamase class C family)